MARRKQGLKKSVHLDPHYELPLPDGTLARALRVGPLYRELRRLKIPDITAQMGKHELLDVYSKHVADIAATLQSPARKAPAPFAQDFRPPPQAVTRRAVALIEEAAA